MNSIRKDRVARLLVMVAAMGSMMLVQCGDTDSGPGTCEELSYVFAEGAVGLLEGMRDCELDADCVLVIPQIECGDRDVQIVECAVAVSATSSDTYLAALAALETEICVGPVTDCHATPGCPEIIAKCQPDGCEAVAQML